MVTESRSSTQVAAGIIRSEGRILICRRPEGAHLAGKWEFPGGKVEPGETHKEALLREIREELDIDVEVGSLRWKTRHTYPDRIVHLRFYECRPMGGDLKDNGVAAHEWVLPADLGRFDFLPADAPLIEMLNENPAPGRAESPQPNLEDAYRACARMAAAHYENFPVASRFLPARMRRHVAALYAFARCADDFADLPGSAPEDERLAMLDEWEGALEAAGEGRAEGDVFTALAGTISVHDLPLQPFRDLIAAFRQDVTVSRYADYSGLLDYCRLSANPVGRIMLMLHGVRDEEAFRASDAICSALQIANHLQDVKEDYLRGRVYLPQADLAAFGVPEEELAGETAGAELRALMAFQIRRTRGLFAEGLPLLGRTGGAFGRELRAIFRGGLAALESIERVDHDILKGSPRLTPGDKAACVAAAFLPADRLGRHIGGEANARADWNYCRWYVRSSRSSFSLAFLSLPPARRRALSAIYGYCRAVDDIADNPGDRGEKLRRLDEWADAVAHLQEREHRHPILRALKPAVAAYGVSIRDLLDVCSGVGMDLDQNRYRTFDELCGYCDKVASAVGLACLKVFGENSEAGTGYGRTLGRALQLTNILRDLWADAAEDRIYLPLDDLRRFGVAEETILRGERTEALTALLRFEGERARELFQKANDLLPKNSHWRLFPARFMGRVYGKVLENMMAADFPGPGPRLSLSKWAKFREAFLCLLVW